MSNNPSFIHLQQQHSGRHALINADEILLIQQTGELDKPTSVLFSSGLGATLSCAFFGPISDAFRAVPGVIELRSGKTGLTSLIQSRGMIVIEQTAELDKPTKVMFAGGLAITCAFTLDEFQSVMSVLNPDIVDPNGIKEARAAIILTP